MQETFADVIIESNGDVMFDAEIDTETLNKILKIAMENAEYYMPWWDKESED